MEGTEMRELVQIADDDRPRSDMSVVCLNDVDRSKGDWSQPSRDHQQPKFNADIESNAVCRSLCSQSSGCPVNLLPAGDSHLPWLFGYGSLSSTARTFINISTKISYTLDVPYFSKSRLLYSMKGWLLFQSTLDTGMPYSFFLFNPYTGERLDLPGMEMCPSGPAAFSTNSSGAPHVVAIVGEPWPGNFGICVARPGDRMWEVHSHGDLSGDCHGFVVRGEQVWCFLPYALLLVLDSWSGRWACFPEVGSACHRIVECCGGEGVFKVSDPPACHRCPPFRVPFSCSKLRIDGGRRRACWVKMDGYEPEGRKWFLGPTPWYSAKDGGKEVYHIRRVCITAGGEEVRGPANPEPQVLYGVTVDDLAEGITYDLLPSPIVGMSEVRWVDLGLSG